MGDRLLRRLTDCESRLHSSRMLMRYIPLDDELSCGDGLWTRDQLERMNDSFTAAVERAFEQRLESPAAARATIQAGSLRNGKGAVIEGAIEAVWDRLCSRKGEMAASEVLAFVRGVCPNVDPACVRAGLAERFFRQRGVGW